MSGSLHGCPDCGAAWPLLIHRRSPMQMIGVGARAAAPRAAHCPINAPVSSQLDERAVAGALEDAPVMHGDGCDEVTAKRPQARERAVLVHVREPAVADHVGRQDRCKLPGLRHADWILTPAPRKTGVLRRRRASFD